MRATFLVLFGLLTTSSALPVFAQDAAQRDLRPDLSSSVPAPFQLAHDWLARLVRGVGDGTRVSYDLDGDRIRFRVDVVSLGLPGRPLAAGEMTFDDVGLTRFRIDEGVAYDRHRVFIERARRQGLQASEIAVLLDAEGPQLGSAAQAALADAMPMQRLRGPVGDSLVVEDAVFEGKGPAAAGIAPDVAAVWKVRMRVGRRGAERRYVATIEPFDGSIIALERR